MYCLWMLFSDFCLRSSIHNIDQYCKYLVGVVSVFRKYDTYRVPGSCLLSPAGRLAVLILVGKHLHENVLAVCTERR